METKTKTFETLEESVSSPRLETKNIPAITDLLVKNLFEQLLCNKNIDLNPIFLESIAGNCSANEIAGAVARLVTILKKPSPELIKTWQAQNILPYPNGTYVSWDNIPQSTDESSWQINNKALLTLVEGGISLKASERISVEGGGESLSASREITDLRDLMDSVKASFIDPKKHQISLTFSQPSAISEIADAADMAQIENDLKIYFLEAAAAGKPFNIQDTLNRHQEYPGPVIRKGILAFIKTLGPNIELKGRVTNIRNGRSQNLKTHTPVTLTNSIEIESFISQKFSSLPENFTVQDLQGLGDIFIRSTQSELDQKRLYKISEIEGKMAILVSNMVVGRDFDVKFLIQRYPDSPNEARIAIAKFAGYIMRNNPDIDLIGITSDGEQIFKALPVLNRFLVDQVFRISNPATFLFRKKEAAVTTTPQPNPQPQPTTLPEQSQTEQSKNQKQLQIYEFSTGIDANYDKDGKLYSRGFSGQFQNNSFPNSKLPEAVRIAVNNELFNGEEDSTQTNGSFISREISSNGKSYSVVAVLTKVRDEYLRSVTTTRYFVAEGHGHLAELTKSAKVFNPRDTQIAGRPRIETFDTTSEQLSNPDLLKLLTLDTPIIIPPNIACTPKDLAILARLKSPNDPISFAFEINALSKYSDFTIIKPANAKAEKIIIEGIRIEKNNFNNADSLDVVDLKLYNYSAKGLSEAPWIPTLSENAIQKYSGYITTLESSLIDPKKQQYYHEGLVKLGLKKQVYLTPTNAPNLIRVAVLSLLTNPSFEKVALLNFITGEPSYKKANLITAKALLDTLSQFSQDLTLKQNIIKLKLELELRI